MIRLNTLRGLDLTKEAVQFRNRATGHFVVLRFDPRGGGALEGGEHPEAEPWRFYQAKGAEANNVEVKRASLEGFNWSDYSGRTEDARFVAWNHAKRSPSAKDPEPPHEWYIEQASDAVFRIRSRVNGHYLELMPNLRLYISGSTGPKIATHPKRPDDAHQLWEIWLDRKLNLSVDPATGVQTAVHNGGYVAMLMGSTRPAALTDAAAKEAVACLDSGLREVVEIVGMPAFEPWSKGRFMNWVVLNTGIPNATAPSDAGHQGNRWGHMTLETTPNNPIDAGKNEYLRGGALHESIHALQSEQWKYNNNGSGWLHESHNCYVGTLREKLVFDRYTMGRVGSVLQLPHVPIESMGELKDGTVGGPADQGASGKQYRGGVYGVYRYGNEIFFLCLYLRHGISFVSRLWSEPARNNAKPLFGVMQDVAGEQAVEDAVMDLGTRGALLDFGGWSDVVRAKVQESWADPEGNWFYTFVTADADGWSRPPRGVDSKPDQRPHHQGRNVIPLVLSAGARSIELDFLPDDKGTQGTKAKFRAQLVYRDKDGAPVYGPRVASGKLTLDLPKGARNDRVALVVGVVNPYDASANAEYGYKLNERFDYKVKLVANVSLAPTTATPW